MSQEPRTIRLHPADDVLVAVDALGPGASVQGIVVRERIPRGHKFSAAPIASGAPVWGVVELNAGAAAKMGLTVGDKVRHPFFDGK